MSVFYWNSELLQPLVGKYVIIYIERNGQAMDCQGVLEPIPVLEDDLLPGHVWLRNGDKRTVMLTKDLVSASELYD